MNLLSRLRMRIAARIRGRPRESAEFRAFVEEAWDWADNRREAVRRVFDLGTYERFSCDQRQGVIVFSTGGVAKVVADVQFVGSTSKLTRTWLWAWANSSVLQELTRAATHLWHAGMRQDFEKLTRAKWYADETDAWEMTAVQAKLTGAEGIYQMPDATGASFLTLKNVRWASEEEQYAPREVEQSFALDRIAAVDRWDAPECIGIEHLLAPAAADFDVDVALESWRWLVPQHVQPLVLTAFGDLFLVTDSGAVLFLDTHVGECAEVAASVQEWREKLRDRELLGEWFMPGLLEELRERGMKVPPGRVYSTKHAIILGGTYSPKNFEAMFWELHFRFHGSVHEQVKDLPDGTPITKIHWQKL